jgi:hypothetical protein
VDAIRTDEKIAPLDAAIAESHFDAGRDGTNLLNLSVEADIDAVSYESVEGSLQVGATEQGVTAECVREVRSLRRSRLALV